jgi:hypothetical protein
MKSGGLQLLKSKLKGYCVRERIKVMWNVISQKIHFECLHFQRSWETGKFVYTKIWGFEVELKKAGANVAFGRSFGFSV